MYTYEVNGFLAELKRQSPDSSEGLENLTKMEATSFQSLLKTIGNLADIDIILGFEEKMI